MAKCPNTPKLHTNHFIFLFFFKRPLPKKPENKMRRVQDISGDGAWFKRKLKFCLGMNNFFSVYYQYIVTINYSYTVWVWFYVMLRIHFLKRVPTIRLDRFSLSSACMRRMKLYQVICIFSGFKVFSFHKRSGKVCHCGSGKTAQKKKDERSTQLHT